MRRLLVPALLIAVSSGPAFAQDPGIQALGVLNPASPYSKAKGVSADGGVVVGETRVGSLTRAFRWTQSAGMVDLGAFEAGGTSGAEEVSDDGSVVVGYAIHAPGGLQQAARWSTSGIQDLGSLSVGGTSGASGVSADGSVVVGFAQAAEGTRGFRWTASGMQNLGTFENQGQQSFAQDVSADGNSVVGYSSLPNDPNTTHAFRWRPGPGMVDLGTPEGYSVSAAFGVSRDGQTAVGVVLPNIAFEPFTAAQWNVQEGMRTFDASMGHAAQEVSADGGLVVGERFILDNPAQGALVWIDGERRNLEDILLDAGVNLNQWSDLRAAYGVSANGRVVVGYGRLVSSDSDMAFRAVLPNRAPTIHGLEPVVVECLGERNFVTLAATISDGESASVTVQWRVDGTLEKTELVPSGEVATFRFDYPDGEHDVEASAFDGELTTIEETSVTVSDTTDPVIVVARNVKVPVNRGKLFASRSRLPEPRVTDLCDEDPRLRNDAPNRLPLGRSVVRWTAIDADGNSATVRQRVTIVNGAPDANAGADARKSTAGSSAKIRLDGSGSSDPDGHALTYAWKAPGIPFVNATTAKPTGTFPVGTTVVTLTVTDPAGAKSTDKVRVVVRQSGALRSAALADAETAQAVEKGRLATASAPTSASFDAQSTAAAALVLGNVASIVEEHPERAEWRFAQSNYSRAAGDAYVRVYLEGAADEALDAAAHSYRGAAYALLDLAR